MKKAEMKPFKILLLELRSRLRGDVKALANTALHNAGHVNGEIPGHSADMGSESFEQDNSLRLMDTEGETLDEIEAALERIEDGVYGSCNECNVRIPKMRLKTIPYTPYCVKCASEIESNKRY